MANRFIKQLIFGVFYLLIIVGIGYGLYFVIIRPAPSCFDNRLNQKEEGIDCGGPCQSCALKNLQPISIFIAPQFLPIDDETGSVYWQLQNANPDYGSDDFSYTLNFYDSTGNLIHSLTKKTFIYPGSIKTLVEAPVKVSVRNVARVEVLIGDARWMPIDKFPMPTLQTRSIKTEFITDQAKVSGLIFNNNSFPLSSAAINILTVDRLGQRVSASKTIINNLQPFEERAFNVFVPLAGQFIDPNATVIYAEGLR